MRTIRRPPWLAGKTGVELATLLLLLFGLTCLIVVVLTHVAEALHIFPSMGWGLPDSAGHYLDLVSAILGCVLLSLGFLIALLGSKARRDEARRQGARMREHERR